MTHMAFSIFYDLQIHGFGVTFATLKKRNVSCDSECPQALPGTNHSIQKKKWPLLAACPLGGCQGISHCSRTKLTKVNSQSPRTLNCLSIYVYIYTHTYIYSCHVLVCGYVVIPVSFLWTFTCVYIELDIFCTNIPKRKTKPAQG